MAIQSLGGMYGPGVIRPRTPEQEGTQESRLQKGAQVAAAPPAPRLPEASPSADATGELPLEAPAGTDPQLWSVLTSDERRFFAQARTMGPLTYGRGTLGLAELGLQRGVRLDVRV